MTSDPARVLSLFGQAIADRALQLEQAGDAPLTGRTRDVGQRVLVPPTAEAGRAGRDARVAVLHQVGYLLFGTADVDCANITGPARQVFFALEDLRVDAAVARQFPGVRADLTRAHAAALDALPRTHPRIVDVIERCSLGWQPADPDEVTAFVLRLTARLRDQSATAYDSMRIARAIGLALDAADQGGEVTALDPLAEALDEQSSPDAGLGRWTVETAEGEVQPADEPLGGAGAEVRGDLDVGLDAQQDAEGRASALPEALGAAAGDPDARTVAQEGERAAASPITRGRRSSFGADRVFLYDEWDHINHRYLRSWCQVNEQRLRGDDVGFIGDVRRRHAVLASQVRRRFAFARSEGWHRVHRTRDGDELEIDAVVEAIVDRHAGHAMNDRLYVRRDRAVREVATAFLVDLSASTSSPIPDPAAQHEPQDPEAAANDGFVYRFVTYDEYDHPTPEPARRVIDIAKESLALMCDALQVLGDRHAMYGFSGQGRADVEFQIAKDFDDPVSMRTWAALAAMTPRRYTRMGPAIRHATTKLHAQAVRTRLLIVLSDGYPQDVDYGPDRADKEYGLQDTARALREAEDLGISTFCVTIDPAGHDYLRRMCPESHYLVISDVTALPGELVKLYRALTSFSPPRRTARPA